MEEIEKTLRLSPIPSTPSHLDLHSLNILFDGNQFILVDWVKGGMCDPFMDLANASVFFNLDEQQIEVFLENYLGHPPSQLH